MADAVVPAAVGTHTTSQYRGTLLTPAVAGFCAVAALLWVVTIAWARGMGNMPGTMGMSVASFVAMWALMMAAMMLPSVAPMALLYSRTATVNRRRRMSAFAGGYLAAWGATGVVAYTLARDRG